MGILPSILPSMLPHLLVQVMIWICHTCVVQNHIIVLPCTVRAVLSASLVLSDFIHPQWVLACHQKCRSLYLCFYAYIWIHISKFSISACVWFHAPVATGQVLAHQLFLLQQCRGWRAQQSRARRAGQSGARAEHALRVSRILGIHLQTVPCAIPLQCQSLVNIGTVQVLGKHWNSASNRLTLEQCKYWVNTGTV